MPLTDNTAQWGVRKLTKFQENSGIPVGFEYFSTNPNIPMGSLPLFGGEYSRTVYADLWSWVQEQTGYLIEESVWQEKSASNDGNVPFYSKGDGITTFRVPSLKCWVKGANGIEEVGSYLSAGLPNITGTLRTLEDWQAGIATGAFLQTKTQSATYSGGNSSAGLINMDASRSNPIYGNSDTVQPKSIVGMWLVKAYGTVTNVGSTDVANIAQGLTELETKASEHANKDLSNLSQDGKKRASSMPSDIIITIASNDFYAPCDGFVSVEASAEITSAATVLVYLDIYTADGNKIAGVTSWNSYGGVAGVFAPICKGNRAIVTYAGDYRSNVIKFIPAISEQDYINSI